MTYDEKKSLYESIMKEVSKRVKRLINESTNANDRSFVQKFLNKAKEISRNNPSKEYFLGIKDFGGGNLRHNFNLYEDDNIPVDYIKNGEIMQYCYNKELGLCMPRLDVELFTDDYFTGEIGNYDDWYENAMNHQVVQEVEDDEDITKGYQYVNNNVFLMLMEGRKRLYFNQYVKCPLYAVINKKYIKQIVSLMHKNAIETNKENNKRYNRYSLEEN